MNTKGVTVKGATILKEGKEREKKKKQFPFLETTELALLKEGRESMVVVAAVHGKYAG